MPARTRTLPSLLVPLALAACATTGATLGSGVGDRMLEQPPYHAGAREALDAAATVGAFPIHYQPGASQPALFDPRWGPGTPLGGFLAEMNAYGDRGAEVGRAGDGA
jgi:hypothetical protein